MKAVVAAALLCLLAAGGARAQMTHEQREEEIQKLRWERGGTHRLHGSDATLSVPDDHMVVLGADAIRFEELIGNHHMVKGLEAVTVNGAEEQVLLQYVEEGYVSLDDWSDIDAKTMLDSISEHTEGQNAERIRDGIEPLHIVGWIEEPALDRMTKTVYWAIAARQGNHGVVNARALRLGRHGFELLTCVGTGDDFRPVIGDLDLMLRSFDFEPGSRYADFTAGDKMAAYSIGGLIATLAGAKLVKAAAAGGLFLFFKKIAIFIVAGAIAALVKLRSVLRRNKFGEPPSSLHMP